MVAKANTTIEPDTRYCPAAPQSRLKTASRQHRPVIAYPIKALAASGDAQYHQCRHGTDDHSVKKHLKHGPHALLLGGGPVGGPVKPGQTAKTGFIGENASGMP